MADVQTTDINTKPTVTAIDSNDQIFISDGGTALKKISYTNLAKAIIEEYNASQLAGATKTIQTAFNELNSNITTLKNVEWKSGISLNTLTADGIYYLGSQLTDAPSSTNGSLWSPMRVYSRTDTIRQVIYNITGGVWIRRFQSNEWGGWIKQPTRDEVDALNNKNILGTTVNANETKNITLVDGSHLYQVTTRQGIYTLRTWVGGGGITALVNDSGVTTSVNGLVVSFTFSSNNYLSVIQLF